jgi:predicted RNA binding protein YcfA (HicA-like mRNA interferase family)
MGFVTTAAEIIAFLVSKGYRRETGHGRHGVKMVKDKIYIPIPEHPGDMPTGTAKNILAMAGYTINDLIDWRR